ncbi:MAG: phosphate signaling complex protein PhoU [Gemmataceae bacterium]|nr:phosphate signaling complex protein PhoU [Gemmataceae bacterium]
MSKHLVRDLDQLQKDILSLAGLVEQSLSKAIRALKERDIVLAREVVQGDTLIDAEENHITEECLKVLALHQPVAIDLRRITSVLMICTDLERMGDLAEEIAERAMSLCRPPFFPVPEGVQRMADLASTMVRQSLDSFVSLDVKLAMRVVRMDDEVDRYNRELIQELVKVMNDSPANIEHGLSVFSAIRHIERIADHATNIAEDVIYLVEGEIVRHRVEDFGRK